MNIIIACEFSGIVSYEFALKGHNVTSCDLLPCEHEQYGKLKNWEHIQGDVIKIIKQRKFDMMICFPPCTYLTWANTFCTKEQRIEAAKFVLELWNADIEMIALENPRGYLRDVLGRRDQELHPFHFGDYKYKRTCLWLKNLPPLIPSCCGIDKKPTKVWIQKSTGKKKYARDLAWKNGKQRSVFHVGFAKAMAQQWG